MKKILSFLIVSLIFVTSYAQTSELKFITVGYQVINSKTEEKLTSYVEDKGYVLISTVVNKGVESYSIVTMSVNIPAMSYWANKKKVESNTTYYYINDQSSNVYAITQSKGIISLWFRNGELRIYVARRLY